MSKSIENLKKLIARHRAEADDLRRMPLQGDFSKSCRDAMVAEEVEQANKFELLLKELEANPEETRPTRNCDRFNTGSPSDDFNSAVKAYAEETGEAVYNCCPGYNSGGNFIVWLLSRQTEHKGK